MNHRILKHQGKQHITQKELCGELYAPKTTINSMIKRQLQTGRIVMQVNEKNKREKVIALTAEGERYAQELIEPPFAIYGTMLSMSYITIGKAQLGLWMSVLGGVLNIALDWLFIAVYRGYATGIAPIISYNYGAKQKKRLQKLGARATGETDAAQHENL